MRETTSPDSEYPRYPVINGGKIEWLKFYDAAAELDKPGSTLGGTILEEDGTMRDMPQDVAERLITIAIELGNTATGRMPSGGVY